LKADAQKALLSTMEASLGRLDKSAFRARTGRSGNAERASIGDHRRPTQPAARHHCHGEPAVGISHDLVEYVRRAPLYEDCTREALGKRRVVLQSVEEHVMFSHIEYWRGGVQQWSVSHSGDVEDKDLKSKGHLPELFNTLRHEQMSRADDGDFFEIPVHMGDQLTGYRYDREYDWMNESPFTFA
jgi:hypothetical protein